MLFRSLSIENNKNNVISFEFVFDSEGTSQDAMSGKNRVKTLSIMEDIMSLIINHNTMADNTARYAENTS